MMREGEPIRILVLEDEFLVALDLEQMLYDLVAGEVIVASTLEQVESIITEERLDWALLDLNIHGQLSLSIAEMLIKRGIRFTFCSGYEKNSFPSTYNKAQVINKPISKCSLMQVIKSLTSEEF